MLINLQHVPPKSQWFLCGSLALNVLPHCLCLLVQYFNHVSGFGQNSTGSTVSMGSADMLLP